MREPKRVKLVKMTRAEAFDYMKARGVAKAVVRFAGGGDEGGVTDISLVDDDDKEIQQLKDVYDGDDYYQMHNDDDRLSAALANEVYTKARGAAKAVVEFKGGGDEGGVTDISPVDDDDKEIQRLKDVHDYQTHNDDDRLSAALVNEVYKRYHAFDGDPYIDGTVTWDVKNNRVTLDLQIQEWTEQPTEEI